MILATLPTLTLGPAPTGLDKLGLGSVLALFYFLFFLPLNRGIHIGVSLCVSHETHGVDLDSRVALFSIARKTSTWIPVLLFGDVVGSVGNERQQDSLPCR